jgi:two-component system chemotaxis sensor kinase CheA
MNWRSLKSSIPAFSPRGLGVLVAVLGLMFLTAVLIPGIKLASELVEGTAALKLVADQRRYSTLLQSSLEVMRDRLNNRGYLQEAADQLRDAVQKIDAAQPAMTAPRKASWFALAGDTGATAGSIAGRSAAQLRELWAREHAVLEPLVGFNGVPYKDSESTGTALNDNGRQLERDIAAAARTSHHVLPELESLLSQISARLQSGNVQAAKELQLVLFMGLLIAAVLVLLVLLMINARQRQDASLREARQQTMDILRTVKDGLFLLDRSLVIGTTFSSALETLFQRRDIAGLSFETLLKHIVSEKTLDTALKFVTVLWLERTNEKLVKSINPLGEVEVHLDAGGGKFETRFLQFEFHRVRVDGKITHILVSVSDVSSRVELARELQNSQSQAQAQVDTLLGILHIDPVQLASFLSDSNAAMKMINAVLREPAREEGAFRKKLDTLFRQAHSVKGEAAALGLSSIESRAHSFEDDLKLLRERPGLSGNDFLPLVIKLDDLLTHLQSVSELVSRLSKFQVPQTEIAFAPAPAADGTAEQGTPALGGADGGLQIGLEQLTARVAAESGKKATLHCAGLDTVPEEYRRIVKDIAIQAVRNAIVHGIEPPAARQSAGKPSGGVVRLVFKGLGEGGYKLSVEDDGRGLVPERIKEVALQKGFITPEQAPHLDAKQTFSLLFRPGFSTVENATKDAGRGVGMNLMADLMQQIGGRVGVATSVGKFTRLTLTLPPPHKPVDDTVAA